MASITFLDEIKGLTKQAFRDKTKESTATWGTGYSSLVRETREHANSPSFAISFEYKVTLPRRYNIRVCIPHVARIDDYIYDV